MPDESDPSACKPQTSSDANTNPKVKAFIDFMKNEVENPPKTGELFKIPDGLSPDWQNFFEKVAAYHERKCAQHGYDLISLEKRSWVMEDNGLSEIEMLLAATNLKDKGNADFRSGKFQEAMMRYFNALFMFATPDAMNNVAACALKMNQFDVAEKFTTNALDMGLLSSPGETKAYFRRATARLHLGKFDAALQDANAANTLTPNDSSIDDLLLLIHENAQNVKNEEDMANYLKNQPTAAPAIPLRQILNWAQENDMQFAKLPSFMIEDTRIKSRPPTF